MLSLIRMNLYRCVKTKSLYIMLLITMAIVGFITLMSSMEEAALDQEMIQQMEETEESTVGIMIGADPITSGVMMTVEFIGSGLILLLVAIFTALFSNSERVGGYLKNLNSCAGSKEQIFIAKLAPVILFVTLEIAIIPLTALIMQLSLDRMLSKDFLLYLVAEWILHIAYGIFILMIMEISRSLVTGILCGVFLGMGVGVLLVNFLESTLLHMDGMLSAHMVVGMVRVLSYENILQVLLPAFGVGIIGSVAYLLIGTIIFKKRDIY